jgi:hypothetical protein
MATLARSGGSSVESVAFSRAGTTLAVGGILGNTDLWRIERPLALPELFWLRLLGDPGP